MSERQMACSVVGAASAGYQLVRTHPHIFNFHFRSVVTLALVMAQATFSTRMLSWLTTMIGPTFSLSSAWRPTSLSTASTPMRANPWSELAWFACSGISRLQKSSLPFPRHTLLQLRVIEAFCRCLIVCSPATRRRLHGASFDSTSASWRSSQCPYLVPRVLDNANQKRPLGCHFVTLPTPAQLAEVGRAPGHQTFPEEVYRTHCNQLPVLHVAHTVLHRCFVHSWSPRRLRVRPRSPLRPSQEPQSSTCTRFFRGKQKANTGENHEQFCGWFWCLWKERGGSR